MADVELLPLPSEVRLAIRAYARANVAHATASKDAEIDALRTRLEDTVRDSTDKIEALRAEVAEAREFRDKLAKAIGNEQLRMFIEKHGEPVPLTLRVQAAEARAERLEEAVRKLEEREQRDEALLKRALEALESADWYIGQLEWIVYSPDDTGTHEERAKVQSTIAALRERIGEGGRNDLRQGDQP
mgnify:FL=1|jgi:hypothetical protein